MSELWQASADGKLEDVKRLVKAGADVNIKGEYKQTPLNIAMYNNHTLVAEYLISLPECDLHARNNTGWTPFINACAFSHSIDMVKLLVLKSVDLNMFNNNGDTGLHMAAKLDASVAEYLISLPGCDINIRNNLGKTALDIAKEANNTDTIHLLEKRASENESYNPDTVMNKSQQGTSAQHLEAFTQCLQVELDQFRQNSSQDIKLQAENIQQDLAAAIVKIDELKIKQKAQGATAAVGSTVAEMPGLVREASSLYSRVKSAKVREPGLTDNNLLELAEELGNDWKTLGGYLGISLSRIQRIIQNHPGESFFCAWVMLVEWRDGHKGDINAKKDVLRKALERNGKMNLVQLV